MRIMVIKTRMVLEQSLKAAMTIPQGGLEFDGIGAVRIIIDMDKMVNSTFNFYSSISIT